MLSAVRPSNFIAISSLYPRYVYVETTSETAAHRLRQPCARRATVFGSGIVRAQANVSTRAGSRGSPRYMDDLRPCTMQFQLARAPEGARDDVACVGTTMRLIVSTRAGSRGSPRWLRCSTAKSYSFSPAIRRLALLAVGHQVRCGPGAAISRPFYRRRPPDVPGSLTVGGAQTMSGPSGSRGALMP